MNDVGTPHMLSAEMPATEFVACALCGGTGFRHHFSGTNTRGQVPGVYSVVECTNCGLTGINPRPVWSDWKPRYELDQTDTADTEVPPGNLRRTDRRLERLRHPISRAVLERYLGYPQTTRTPEWARWLAPVFRPWIGHEIPPYRGQGRVLDVGCNNGLFLYLLKGINCTVQGIELNAALCQAAESIGVPVHRGILQEAPFAPGSFDVVRMCQVLEHIHDPLEVLRHIRRLLAHDGVAIIEVPNRRSASFYLFRELWFGIPGHVYGFEPRTLTALAALAGLERVAIRYKSSKGWVTNCMSLWSRTGRSWRHRLVGRLAHAAWFRRCVVGPYCQLLIWCRFGDIMHLHFRPQAATSSERAAPVDRQDHAPIAP